MAPGSDRAWARSAAVAPDGSVLTDFSHAFDPPVAPPCDCDAALPPLRTTVTVERARQILSRNDSPDIPFDRAINPYRGCEHGCVYCFARPTHAYLGWSPGLDFETRLIAKENAVEALRRELSRPGYRVEPINIGAATDAYQPIERQWKLTRGLLELLLETRHPVTIVTKGALLTRDVDLLAALAERNLVAVYVSVPTLDPDVARKLEPRAAAPHRRIESVRTLSSVGVPVGVSLAPVIPFITDDQMEHVLAAAQDAGARTAFYTMLRLPWEVKTIFSDWLDAHFPDRAARVLHRIEDLRGGKQNDPRFGTRMRGEGIWAELYAQRFAAGLRKAGMVRERVELDRTAFVAPVRTGAARGARGSGGSGQAGVSRAAGDVGRVGDGGWRRRSAQLRNCLYSLEVFACMMSAGAW
ncbi:PA0069 family radical SAM protein [Pigmentiphaga litoralis]|uniref:PA0069 family radical SAM protein n=1 Tax=Pigmentiphaga litoralis TaxID=516702 RepID=UPI003B42BEAD